MAGKVGDGITIYWTRPQKRDLILRRFTEAATKAGKDPETMTKTAYFPFLGITSDPLPIVRNIKASLVQHIHEDDPRKIDELAKTLSDEEALQYCTLLPVVDDVIGVFDSAIKAGINHIMRDLTPIIIQNKLAPREAAGWLLRALPYLREKYK